MILSAQVCMVSQGDKSTEERCTEEAQQEIVTQEASEGESSRTVGEKPQGRTS